MTPSSASRTCASTFRRAGGPRRARHQLHRRARRVRGDRRGVRLGQERHRPHASSASPAPAPTVRADALHGRRAATRRGSAERDWRRLRGRVAGLVLQDALVSLDPLRTVGAEIGEVLRTHASVPRATATAGSIALLDAVGVPEPERARAAVSAPAVRRAAPAGADRLGHRRRPAAAHRRRADHRAGRDRPGADPAAARRAQAPPGTTLLLISHDLAVVARHRRPGPGHAGRRDRRAGADRRGCSTAPAARVHPAAAGRRADRRLPRAPAQRHRRGSRCRAPRRPSRDADRAARRRACTSTTAPGTVGATTSASRLPAARPSASSASPGRARPPSPGSRSACSNPTPAPCSSDDDAWSGVAERRRAAAPAAAPGRLPGPAELLRPRGTPSEARRRSPRRALARRGRAGTG